MTKLKKSKLPEQKRPIETSFDNVVVPHLITNRVVRPVKPASVNVVKLWLFRNHVKAKKPYGWVKVEAPCRFSYPLEFALMSSKPKIKMADYSWRETLWIQCNQLLSCKSKSIIDNCSKLQHSFFQKIEIKQGGLKNTERHLSKASVIAVFAFFKNLVIFTTWTSSLIKVKLLLCKSLLPVHKIISKKQYIYRFRA